MHVFYKGLFISYVELQAEICTSCTLYLMYAQSIEHFYLCFKPLGLWYHAVLGLASHLLLFSLLGAFVSILAVLLLLLFCFIVVAAVIFKVFFIC